MKRLSPKNHGPRIDEQEKLYNICREFVEKKDISCPESIWQCDRVTENIEVLIDKICNIIGFAHPPKD